MGVYGGALVVLERCIVAGNHVWDRGGGLAVRDGATVDVFGTVFDANVIDGPSGRGSALDLTASGRALVRNNALLGHDTGGAAIHVSWAMESPWIASNLVAFGGVPGVWFDAGPGPTLLFNDWWSLVGGDTVGMSSSIGTNGNLSVDPLLTAWSDDGDPTNDDMTLRPGSPCRDAGLPSPTWADPDGSRNDIGPLGGPG